MLLLLNREQNIVFLFLNENIFFSIQYYIRRVMRYDHSNVYIILI